MVDSSCVPLSKALWLTGQQPNATLRTSYTDPDLAPPPPPPPQAMYERLFCWIVGRINDVIEVKNYDARVHGKNTVIGVLDIYGFEIFQNNRLGLELRPRVLIE